MTASWMLMLVAANGAVLGLIAVVIGVTVLDIGMQAQHITNQSVLLSAYPNLAGRVTTVYMGSNVLAGACGSALATHLFPIAGWPALSITGLVCGLLALLVLRGSHPAESASQDDLGQAAGHEAAPAVGLNHTTGAR